MILLPDRPPFHELQVEHLARSFAERRAWWAWCSSKESNQAFQTALRKLGVRGFLSTIESGAIIYFEFAAEGKRFAVSDVPRFNTLRWLDIQHAKKVLHRVRELEVVGGVRDPMPAEELDSMLATYEQARIESLPKLRQQVKTAEAGMQ